MKDETTFTLSKADIAALEQILGRFLTVTRTPYPGPGVSKEEIKQADAKEQELAERAQRLRDVFRRAL